MYLEEELMNKNDTEKAIYYYDGRFIFVVWIITF